MLVFVVVCNGPRVTTVVYPGRGPVGVALWDIAEVVTLDVTTGGLVDTVLMTLVVTTGSLVHVWVWVCPGPALRPTVGGPPFIGGPRATCCSAGGGPWAIRGPPGGSLGAPETAALVTAVGGTDVTVLMTCVVTMGSLVHVWVCPGPALHVPAGGPRPAVGGPPFIGGPRVGALPEGGKPRGPPG